MRAAYHLAFAVFSLGAVATPTTAPNVTNQAGTSTFAAQKHAVLEAVSRTAANFAASSNSRSEDSSEILSDRGVSIGDTLPETVELHPIARHETYRYAVVNNQRVIVDAGSRKVVYVIQ